MSRYGLRRTQVRLRPPYHGPMMMLLACKAFKKQAGKQDMDGELQTLPLSEEHEAGAYVKPIRLENAAARRPACPGVLLVQPSCSQLASETAEVDCVRAGRYTGGVAVGGYGLETPRCSMDGVMAFGGRGLEMPRCSADGVRSGRWRVVR